MQKETKTDETIVFCHIFFIIDSILIQGGPPLWLRPMSRGTRPE